jgi:multidrug resistance protein, MATE family
VLGQLAIVGMNLIDTVLAGRISAQVLAEVSIGSAIWGVSLLWIIGVMMAISPEIAGMRGRAGPSNLGAALGAALAQGLYLALAVAVFALILVPLSPHIMVLLKVDSTLIPGATRFLHGIAFGAPFLAWYVCLQKFCEGMGRPKATLYFSVLGLVLLLPLAYVLMNGKLGLPRLEARGSGLATAAVYALNALLLSIYVRKQFRAQAALRVWPAWDWRRQWELLRFGGPIAVAILMEAGLFYAVLLLMSRFGKDWVAAHSVALNVASMAFMMPLGLANAVTVRAGYFAGAGDLAAARRVAYAGWTLCLATQAFSATIMLSFATQIAAGYLPNEVHVQPMAVSLMLVAALFQFPDGIQVISNGALRGLKDSQWPMLITSLAFWGFGFPLAYHLAFQSGVGPTGLWYGFIAGLGAAAVLLTARFLWLTRAGKLLAQPIL